MKKLALLGMLLTVSSNVLFAADQCETGTEKQASEAKAEKSKEGDSKILVQDEKK